MSGEFNRAARQQYNAETIMKHAETIMKHIDVNGVAVALAEAGAGEPVVLLHSSASSNRQWQAAFDALAGDHRVIAPDLYGYGMTGPWPAAAGPTLADETAMVDAVTTCGNKWLCGHYATGFCWLRPELRESLIYDQAYWVANLGPERLANVRTYVLRDDLGAAKYDVFGTANLNNFMPWTESVETLLDAGMAAIAAHDQALVSRLIDGLDDAGYRLLSPRDGAMRSTLVMVSHRRAERNAAIHRALAANRVFVALREGNLRFSPHLYNSNADIDRALEALNAA